MHEYDIILIILKHEKKSFYFIMQNKASYKCEYIYRTFAKTNKQAQLLTCVKSIIYDIIKTNYRVISNLIKIIFSR